MVTKRRKTTKEKASAGASVVRPEVSAGTGAGRAEVSGGFGRTNYAPQSPETHAGTGETFSDETKRPSTKKRTSTTKRRKWSRRVLLIFLALVFVGVALVVWLYWFCYNDARDVQGTWQPASTSATQASNASASANSTDGTTSTNTSTNTSTSTSANTSSSTNAAQVNANDTSQSSTTQTPATNTSITIDSTSIQITSDVAYTYELDSAAKIINFSFGNKTGSGHYCFSFDRQTLVFIDGQSASPISFFQDLSMIWESFIAPIQGREVALPEGSNVVVLKRAS